MTIKQKLDEMRQRCEAATPGPGEILHSEHMATPGMKEKTLSAISEAIDASIKFDGGHPWWWIVAGEKTVAHFGCGPTSEKNAEFWATARTDLPKLIEVVELCLAALEQMKYVVPHGRFQIISKEALAKAEVLLVGEGRDVR